MTDPKDGPDGPSIGLAIMSAFISLALDKPPKAGIAVTGEIDLNGNVTLKIALSVFFIHF